MHFRRKQDLNNIIKCTQSIENRIKSLKACTNLIDQKVITIRISKVLWKKATEKIKR